MLFDLMRNFGFIALHLVFLVPLASAPTVAWGFEHNDAVQVFTDSAVPPTHPAWGETAIAAAAVKDSPFVKTIYQPDVAHLPGAPVSRAEMPGYRAKPDAAIRRVAVTNSEQAIDALRDGLEADVKARLNEKFNEGRVPQAPRFNPTASADAALQTPVLMADSGDEAAVPLVPPQLKAPDDPASLIHAPHASAATERALADPPAGDKIARNAAPQCVDKTLPWRHSCAEVGYPAEYEGEIRGETRTNCATGTISDNWITNSCALRGAQATPSEQALTKSAGFIRQTAPQNTAALPAVIVGAEQPQQQVRPPKQLLNKLENSRTILPETESATPVVAEHTASRVDGTRNELGTMCGAAAARAAVAMPDHDLCARGTPSVVSGSNPWHWYCTDGNEAIENCATVSPVLAECGAQRGTCNSGQAGAMRSDDSWDCDGGAGGTTVQCATPLATPDLLAAPAKTAKKAKQNSTKKQRHAAKKKSKTAQKSPPRVATEAVPDLPIDGICGAAAQRGSATMPTDNLCAAGVATLVGKSGVWVWRCVGIHEGFTVTCNAPIIEAPRLPMTQRLDGACGRADGTASLAQPTRDLCNVGTVSAMAGKGPWSWDCVGTNDGASAHCVAQKAEVEAPSLKQAEPIASDSLMPPQLSSDAMPEPPTALPAPPPLASLPTLSQLLPKASSNVLMPGTDSYVPAPPVRAPGTLDATPPAAYVIDPKHKQINFATGSDVLDETAIDVLMALGKELAAHPEAHVTATAYADLKAVGNDTREARRLSLARALAVRDTLMVNGATDNQIKIRAQGANVPSGHADRVDLEDR